MAEHDVIVGGAVAAHEGVAMNEEERDKLLAEVIDAQRVVASALAVLLSHQQDQERVEDAMTYWLPQLRGKASGQLPSVSSVSLADQMQMTLKSAARGAYKHPRAR